MAGYEVHGWMAAKILSLIVLLTVSEVLAKEPSVPPDQRQGKPVYFDVDKAKLHGMWYLGALRGLIKMKARASLQETSWIETTVYQQCEGNAKSTVDLAKCAVRLFDARDYSRERQSVQEKVKKPDKPVVNISVKKSVLKTTDSVSPVYSTKQHSKLLTKKKKHYYYKPGYGWVKNPVRSQARIRRTRRDTIDEAWDRFLAEERKKEKRKMRELTKEKYDSEDDPMRNIMGIKRLLGRESASRTKRKVEETAPIRGSTQAVDFSKLAAEYLKNFIGKGDGISNLEKLRKIKDYVDKSEKIKAYYKLMNDENQSVMNEYGIRSEDPQIEKDASDVLLNIVNIVNDFAEKKLPSSKFSILSPRLFSLMPDKQKSNRLISPTMFSFHNDGFFSLPGILDILMSDKRNQQHMLEMMLDLSGATLALDRALDTLKKDMNDLDNVHYPLLQEISRHDHNWIRAKRSFSDEQLDQYDKLGFTYLNKEQMDLMYANKNFTNSWGMNTTALAGMSLEEKDIWVEKQIREIAATGRPVWPFWNQSVRRRRQAAEGGPQAFVPEINEHHEGISVQTLEPIAFSNFINEGISLELITLSPRAFLSEILAPEALTVHTLSPRAFVATILSPSALMTRILSPGALRAEVLSPRALQAWILSPEALIAEVLTPHFIEPYILSPEALVIFVLSPKFLSPKILSPETMGVVVLSPNILSPRIASEEKMLVEVLSPHILGGPHSHEEAHHDILEVGSHSEHSDEGHPHEHTEGHDEHGHPIQGALPHEAAHADAIQALQQPLPPPGEDPVSQFFRNLG